MKEPRPYQLEMIERGVQRNTYIAAACGAGKTITAIEICKRFRERQRSRVCLVVLTPKVAMLQWKREILGQDEGARVFIWDIEHPFPEIGDWSEPAYVITHYEHLQLCADEAKGFQWCVVVADEAHKIKSPFIDRTKAVRAVPALRKIAMSGTPFHKSPDELWSPFHWLDPGEFPSYWEFSNKFCVRQPGVNGGPPKFVGVNPHKRDELARIMKRYMIRKSKKEIDPELPPLLKQLVPIELRPAQRALYERVRKARDIEVRLFAAEGPEADELEPMLVPAAARFTRLHQIATNPGLLEVSGVGSAKLEWLEGYVENNPGEQMLIFTLYRENAIQIANLLGRKRRVCGLIVGARKPELLEEFLDGRVRLLAGTIDGMGTALDLPMARTAIFVDCSWKTISMAQAMDRHHRIGITEPKHVITLEAVGTVDELVRASLEHSWNTSQLMYRFMETVDG